MAHFYASIEGNRGSATRMGTKTSGISGHVRGWNMGIRVCGYVNSDGQDAFKVYLTGGSNGHQSDVVVGDFAESRED